MTTPATTPTIPQSPPTPTPASPKALRIVRIQAQNIMRVRAIDITPHDPLILIAGPNDSGKSSVLNAITLALDADKAQKHIDRPIRDGETHGRIDLDLEEIPLRRSDLQSRIGEQIPATTSSPLDFIQDAIRRASLTLDKYHVTRTFTDTHSYLTVRGKDGKECPSPQALLDSFIGDLSFDPEEFDRKDSKTQRATLLKLVHLSVDLDSLHAEAARIEADRTQVNRDLKQKQGALASLGTPAADLPHTETAATTVLAALQAAQDHRLANATERQRLDTLRRDAKTAKEALGTLDAEIHALDVKLQGLRTDREKKQQDYAALLLTGKDLAAHVEQLLDPDLGSLQHELATIEQRNAAIREGQKSRTLAAEIETLRGTSEAMTTALAGIEHTKAEALQTAQFPIPGLGFTDEGITYQGIPFQQCSTSEKRRVCLAIAMALNPALRVIRIREGNVFDRQSLAMIREAIQADDYQVWLEWVDDTGTVGIQIEDGMIKGAEPPGPIRRLTTPRQPAALPSGPPPPALAPPAATPRPDAPPTQASRPAPAPPAGSPAPAPAKPPVPPATQPALPGAPTPSPRPTPPRPPLRTPTYATRSGPKGR